MSLIEEISQELYTDESWVGVSSKSFIQTVTSNIGEYVIDSNIKSRLNTYDSIERYLASNLQINGAIKEVNFSPRNSYYNLKSFEINKLETTTFFCKEPSSFWIDLDIDQDTEFLLNVENDSVLFLKINIEIFDKARVNFGILINNNSGECRVNLCTNFRQPKSEVFVTILSKNSGKLSICNRQLHPFEGCKSDSLFKFLGLESSYTHFWGLIEIMSEAQNSDAYQLARAMLIGQEASGNLIPNLKIGANQVRCTHGASFSTINPNDIFYLRSRGFSLSESVKFLTDGFLLEGVSRLPEKFHNPVENFVLSLK